VTEIDFHFNAADKVSHACRLLRKAVAANGARVVVTGDPDVLDTVDAALWAFSPADFIGHCRSDGDAQLLSRSAVVLAAASHADALPHRQVLVNLGDAVPAGFERFERLIEVVTGEEADRVAGRARWRHYAERGYAMKRHDLGSRASS
jgi:DNA polymerase-3 subunit chi